MEARVGYVESRGEWVAVLVEDDEIVCIGCEMTEEAATAWAREALRFHTEVEGAEHPQDMHDRAGGSNLRH